MSKDRSKVIKKERGKMGKLKDNSILKNIVVFVKSHQNPRANAVRPYA